MRSTRRPGSKGVEAGPEPMSALRSQEEEGSRPPRCPPPRSPRPKQARPPSKRTRWSCLGWPRLPRMRVGFRSRGRGSWEGRTTSGGGTSPLVLVTQLLSASGWTSSILVGAGRKSEGGAGEKGDKVLSRGRQGGRVLAGVLGVGDRSTLAGCCCCLADSGWAAGELPVPFLTLSRPSARPPRSRSTTPIAALCRHCATARSPLLA